MSAPSVSQQVFDVLPDGEEVTRFTLRNSSGMSVDVLNVGAIITAINTPDRAGNVTNVVLGFDRIEPYLGAAPYFGALVGRYANRIAGGKFSIEGEQWQVATNHGAHHLHGGEVGFDKVLWHASPFVNRAEAGITFFHLSRNGDQGYPGNLQVTVTYRLNDDNTLVVDYHAITDASTPVNLTQHSYFNLAGEGDVLAHDLYINADYITPVDADIIPTGERLPVADTAFDFRETKSVGRDIQADHPQLILGSGYDHNYILNKTSPRELSLAARVTEPRSGRVLEVFTEEPGVQLYTSNFLDGSLRSGERVFKKHGALCLETQHFPDSPNQPDFPNTILHPGEEYYSRTCYRFSVVAEG